MRTRTLEHQRRQSWGDRSGAEVEIKGRWDKANTPSELFAAFSERNWTKTLRHWRTKVKMIYPILIDKFMCSIVTGGIRVNHIFIKLNGKCGLRTTLVGKYLFQHRFEWYGNLRKKLQWKRVKCYKHPLKWTF